MKLQSHSRLVKTNIESETRDFGIDAEDAQGLTILLRDTLYEDKILAPIREYITNAFDANEDKYPSIVFKRPTAIKIQLPTSDSPQFSVRDYGFGLTEDEIFNIFTRYGKSTKRDSNSVTGCFGIGSKSYAAYTDKATIVSRTTHGNNEIDAATYVMYLDENQQAKIKHVRTDNYKCDGTLDGNTGLEITWGIKLDDIQTVKEKFLSLYHAWDPNKYKAEVFEILDNKKSKVNIDEREYTINTNHYLIEKNSKRKNGERYDYKLGRYVVNDSAVIMGPIQYPLKTETIKNSLSEKEIAFLGISGLTIKLDLGAVGVTGSREGLSYNALTISAISSKINVCLKHYEEDLKKGLSECKTWFEAYTKAQSIRNNIPNELREQIEFKWNGMDLDWTLRIPYEMPNDDVSQINADLIEFSLTKNKNNEVRIQKQEVTSFSIQDTTVLFTCDVTKTTKHTAARKVKHKIMELWNEDCRKFSSPIADGTPSQWVNNVRNFRAYLVYLNDPSEQLCYAKDPHKNVVPSSKKHVLSIAKLPKWFEGLKQIDLANVEIPKVVRVKTKKENRPNKILAIDFTVESWRGAISPTPTEYDLDKEICTLVTSNYSPTTRDVKDYKQVVNVPGQKNMQYNKLTWQGSPKLMEKVLNKIGNPTVMPIRASELKKKNNKHLPSFSELAMTWAIECLKSNKKDINLCTIDIMEEMHHLDKNPALCRLLFNARDSNMAWSDYHMSIATNPMSYYKGNANREDKINKLKDKKLINLLNNYISIYNEAHTIQTKRNIKLALNILWATDAYYINLVSEQKTKHQCLDPKYTMEALRKAFNVKTKNTIEDKRLKLSTYLSKKYPIIHLLAFSHSYYEDRQQIDHEEFMEISKKKTFKKCTTSADLLVSVLNKEIK